MISAEPLRLVAPHGGCRVRGARSPDNALWRRALLVAIALALVAPTSLGSPTHHGLAQVPWGRESARELLRRAERQRDTGQVADALYLATEAVRVDGTFGPAWLYIARLREQMRDYLEAERVYTHATRLRSIAAEALAGRATLRRRMGRSDQALADLERSVALDAARPERWKVLGGWYAERRAWPAALAAWRHVLGSMTDASSKPEYRNARIRVAALARLSAELDPVLSPPAPEHWVRQSLARIAAAPSPQ